jgi:MFS family permease
MDRSSVNLRKAGNRQGLIIQLASSLTIMGSVMIAPMLPKITAEFAAIDPKSVDLIPLVVAGPALAIALFAPLAGLLADRLGRKTMLLIGSVLYAVFGVMPAFLGDLNHILISRLLFGCAEAIIMTCCTTLIADYWPAAERMRYISRQVVTIGIVGALFFVIGGVAGEGSWRTPFFLYLAPIVLLPAIMLLLWEPDRRKEEVNGEGPASAQRGLGLTVAAAYFLIFTGMVTSFVAAVMTPNVLVAIGVTSTSLIGAAAGLSILSTLGGSIAWPFVRDRIGVAGVNAFLVVLMALGLFILALAGSYTEVLIAMLVQGFGAGFLVANASLPLLMKLPPRLRARGVGGFASFLYLGQFASPFIIMALAGPLGGMPQGLPAAIITWSSFTLLIAAAWAVVGLSNWRRPIGETSVS